ncbi:MAG: hypothetical protein IPP61_21665 [Cytophagaceae bacterium]|nr:hypothetical protein [Cytophagaceae bacterium]MBK9934340.1 hypothetical protein [Cytophagaceae bacterium]MBL0327731.1 hypothetical protein [Cytophagaceae bacterium]
MKKNIALTLILLSFLSVNTFAQIEKNWALGLKVGEPLGLNIRKYLHYGERAFDFNVGTYGFLIGSNRNYKKDPRFDQAGISFQGLYHYYKSLGKEGKFGVYYGYGAFFNLRNEMFIENNIRNNDINQFSIGPAINGGIEMDIPENDLTVFLDAGGFMELAPKPLFLAPALNLGLRVNLVK